ncbi:MAG: VPLPA-CTERM sorting domain-containing protein, partial [Roseibium sp.]
KNLVLGVGLFLASLSAANAATYRIDGFQNLVANGFGSTLFHEATGCGGMCGTHADRATGTGSGSWDSASGNISFMMGLVGGGTATARGVLNTTARTSGTATGIAGLINIVISGSAHGKNGSYDFTFLDASHNSVANWFDNGTIGLWGAAPASAQNAGALGVDFRINVTPVPLPAGVVLLLSGIGGFTIFGRRRFRT